MSACQKSFIPDHCPEGQKPRGGIGVGANLCVPCPQDDDIAVQGQDEEGGSTLPQSNNNGQFFYYFDSVLRNAPGLLDSIKGNTPTYIIQQGGGSGSMAADEEEKSSGMSGWIIGLVLVLIVSGAFLYYKSRQAE